MPSSTWEHLPREKQERVLEAAAREFGAHGFSSGSLNVIAKNAGVAKGSLFQYFEDKLDLFRFVYAELAAGTRHAMEARIVGHLEAGDDLFELCRHVLVEFIEFHREHQLEGDILRAMTFESDGEVRAMLRDVVDGHYVDLIGSMVQLAHANGVLRANARTDILAALIHNTFMTVGVAGITPEMNPFVPLHELEGEELAEVVAGFLDPIEAFFAASALTPAQ